MAASVHNDTMQFTRAVSLPPCPPPMPCKPPRLIRLPNPATRPRLAYPRPRAAKAAQHPNHALYATRAPKSRMPPTPCQPCPPQPCTHVPATTAHAFHPADATTPAHTTANHDATTATPLSATAAPTQQCDCGGTPLSMHRAAPSPRCQPGLPSFHSPVPCP